VTLRGSSILGLILPPLLAGLWAAALGIEHVKGDMWFLGRVEATMTDLRTGLRGERAPPGKRREGDGAEAPTAQPADTTAE